jgi:hydrogenase nickel incorporation protein HypB
MIVTKMDLLPYVPFDLEQAKTNARQVHPGIEIIELSCQTGQGMDEWKNWLTRRRLATRERFACAGA